MADQQTERDRELVVPPYTQAFVRDDTNGKIKNIVGPMTETLTKQSVTVRFDIDAKQFVECGISQALSKFTTAPEGWYVVLKNPAKQGTDQHPSIGSHVSGTELRVGEKVILPGPVSFALHPGQMTRVLKGHTLHSNEYLVCRVYNEDQAKAHSEQTVIKPVEDQGTSEDNDKKTKKKAEAVIAKATPTNILPADLHMGAEFVIRGTEASFFIPPTGIEVLPDEDGNYVRQAVTLQDLELCILLDQSGSRRYEYGPTVVFPTATETFVKGGGGQRKFRAIELNPQTALHIKVIAGYQESEDDIQMLGAGHGSDNSVYAKGDELFITGSTTRIYYPRPEHSLISHDDGGDGRIYAVAIPDGEGRYLLNKETGRIETMRGPNMLLPDPRTHVFVRRILTDEQCRLWFPGNEEVLRYNRNLRKAAEDDGAGRAKDFVPEHAVRSARLRSSVMPEGYSVAQSDAASYLSASMPGHAWETEGHTSEFGGEKLERKSEFTPPRTIELDTRFEGAVRIATYPGYAVMVASRGGERTVVQGPNTVLLEYDQELEPFLLSTSRGHQKKEVYLGVDNNRVRDTLEVLTSDMVPMSIGLRYRLRFTGDDAKLWFNVEDYPRLVRESMSSRIRNMIKDHSVQEVIRHGIDLLRDCVLGTKPEPEEGDRLGHLFRQNGGLIYDLEISRIVIADSEMSSAITRAQREAVDMELRLLVERRRLDATIESEDIKRSIADAEQGTALAAMRRESTEIAERLRIELESIAADMKATESRHEVEKSEAEFEADIELGRLAVNLEKRQASIDVSRKVLEVTMAELGTKTDAYVKQIGAISPELAAKLELLSDRIVTTALIEKFEPMAMLKGQSLVDVLAQFVHGSPAIKDIGGLFERPKYGADPVRDGSGSVSSALKEEVSVDDLAEG